VWDEAGDSREKSQAQEQHVKEFYIFEELKDVSSGCKIK
jgi:hypothetical protein